MWFFVKESPKIDKEVTELPLLEKEAVVKPDATFFDSCMFPGVLPCSLCYAGLKLVNYGFLMWLPYYLGTAYGFSLNLIGIVASLYDLGAVSGSVFAGVISD